MIKSAIAVGALVATLAITQAMAQAPAAAPGRGGAAAAGAPGRAGRAPQPPVDPYGVIPAGPTGRADKTAQPAMLDPDNLAKPRPKAPFDVTGVWQLDNRWSENSFRDVPKNPTPVTQKMLDEAKEYAAKHIPYNDDTGQCWPTGLPRIMTRVWPIQMIQVPTGISMVYGFMNEARWIYMDGRKHTDIDLVTSTWNGESVGHWEGKTLVVDTIAFNGKHHWMDEAIPVGENAHLIERITMPDPNTIVIDQTWDDKDHWNGEYKNRKIYRRQWGVDVVENHCLPDTNAHILAAGEAPAAEKEAAKNLK